MTFIQSIIAHGDTAILAVITAILAIDRYRSGSSGLRKEIAADYKERNAQLEEKIQTNVDEIQKTNLEVARLNGVVGEKDKHIETLTNILKDKNPETLKLLQEIKDGNATVHKFMEQVFDFMKKSNEELGYQTEILEKGQQRDKKIDKASKTHVGVPVRIPLNGKKLKAKKK